MISYERTYATGRTVVGILEFFGWLIVVVGVILALMGFSTGGLAGAMFDRGDPPFVLRAVAMMPGLGLVLGGIIGVALAQLTKASLDTAEMTREMLKISRSDSRIRMAKFASGSEEPPVGSSYTTNELSMVDGGRFYPGIYLGQKIDVVGEFHQVDGRYFNTSSEAEKYVDSISTHSVASKTPVDPSAISWEPHSEHKGVQILHGGGKFLSKGTVFDTLRGAINFLDRT